MKVGEGLSKIAYVENTVDSFFSGHGVY